MEKMLALAYGTPLVTADRRTAVRREGTQPKKVHPVGSPETSVRPTPLGSPSVESTRRSASSPYADESAEAQRGSGDIAVARTLAVSATPPAAAHSRPTVATSVASSPWKSAPSPLQHQMKLSDFFSKMACKK